MKNNKYSAGLIKKSKLIFNSLVCTVLITGVSSCGVIDLQDLNLTNIEDILDITNEENNTLTDAENNQSNETSKPNEEEDENSNNLLDEDTYASNDENSSDKDGRPGHHDGNKRHEDEHGNGNHNEGDGDRDRDGHGHHDGNKRHEDEHGNGNHNEGDGDRDRDGHGHRDGNKRHEDEHRNGNHNERDGDRDRDGHKDRNDDEQDVGHNDDNDESPIIVDIQSFEPYICYVVNFVFNNFPFSKFLLGSFFGKCNQYQGEDNFNFDDYFCPIVDYAYNNFLILRPFLINSYINCQAEVVQEDSDSNSTDPDSDNSGVETGTPEEEEEEEVIKEIVNTYLKPNQPISSSNFGQRVVVSSDGSTIAVSQLSNGDGRNRGSVVIFKNLETNSEGQENTEPNWQQIALISPNNSDQLDFFGDSISLSADGSVLAVGASEEDSNATGINGNQANDYTNAMNSGAVYLFEIREDNSWEQTDYIKASNTGRRHLFGWSLALSEDGNTLAVGAIGESSAASGINGVQEDDSSSKNSGAVYLFSKSVDNGWEQIAYLKASNSEANDKFGYSLSLNQEGSILAVGAVGEDSATNGVSSELEHGNNDDTENSGAVYLFAKNNSNLWEQTHFLKAETSNYEANFGFVVSLSSNGNTLVVGAPYQSVNTSESEDKELVNSGQVFVYQKDENNAWSSTASLSGFNKNHNDQFGLSVGVSSDGRVLIVGANGEDSEATGYFEDLNIFNNQSKDSGAVYVYQLDANEMWQPKAFVKATNAENYDSFGYSVSLSKDGSILVSGSPGEDSDSSEVNGEQGNNNDFERSGAAYIYTSY